MIAKVNGMELYYQVSGEGRPIILVHGNGEDHEIFDETVRLLEQSYTVYAIDSRDHGKSSRVEELHYEDMADDVIGFVRALGIDRPMYCGFSDGGNIGLIAASKEPKLFSKLVLCGANLRPSGVKTAINLLFGLLYLLKRDSKTRMMLYEPDITAADLTQITVPTLILMGQKDIIKKNHIKELTDGIKGSRLKILPGEDHGSYIVHSRKLYDEMKDFLEDRSQTCQ